MDNFLAFFSKPSPAGIGLALLFGMLWLLMYWPHLPKQCTVWLALAGGALLTALAAAFIQLPLIEGVSAFLRGLQPVMSLAWYALLFNGLAVLISGLTREGAKLVPVLLVRLRRGGKLESLEGLLLGAAAGAGFGILEAQWVHNSLIASGWGAETLRVNGLLALLPLWERFIMLGLQVGLGALAGYSLGKGRGWSGWLLAAFIHALANFSTYLIAGKLVSTLAVEIYLTAASAVLAVVMLSIRWERKEK